MFGSATLEVAIGLAFVYLLFSLVCTSLTEGVARMLRLRASTLQSAIINMIAGEKGEQDNTGVVHAFYENSLIKSLAKSSEYDKLLAWLGSMRKWINCNFPWAYIILGILLIVPGIFALATRWIVIGSGGIAPIASWAILVIGGLLGLNGARLQWREQIFRYLTNETWRTLLYAEIPSIHTLVGLLLIVLGSSASPLGWLLLLVGLFLLLLGLPQYAKGRPSYIQGPIFALALLDTLVKKGINPTTDLKIDTLKSVVQNQSSIGDLPVKSTLRIFLAEAAGKTDPNKTELEVIQARVEGWFKDVMERVTGWYTRKTRAIVAILAIFITVAMNIDTLAIAGALSRDATLRSSVVNAADRFLVAHRTVPPVAPAGSPANDTELGTSQPVTLTLSQLEGEIAVLGIPIGWVTNQPITGFQPLPMPFVTTLVITPGMSVTVTQDLRQQYNQANKDRRIWPPDRAGWGKKLAGLLLTIIALSLGASFWFDRLKELMNLRGTGKSPEETKNNSSNSG
jgi:hypothetical protein